MVRIFLLAALLLGPVSARRECVVDANCGLEMKGYLGEALNVVLSVMKRFLQIVSEIVDDSFYCQVIRGVEQVLCLIADIFSSPKINSLEEVTGNLFQALGALMQSLECDPDKPYCTKCLQSGNKAIQELLGEFLQAISGDQTGSDSFDFGDLDLGQLAQTLLPTALRLVYLAIKLVLCLVPAVIYHLAQIIKDLGGQNGILGGVGKLLANILERVGSLLGGNTSNDCKYCTQVDIDYEIGKNCFLVGA